MIIFSPKSVIGVLFFSLFILLGTQGNLPALAEEASNIEKDLTKISSQEEASIKEAKVVSRVGFMDPKITSQEKNLFWLDFAIENPGPPESDISYGVQLTKKTDTGSVLVDEFFFNEKVSVSPEQSINRRVAYLAPEFLTGNFQLWLLAKQSTGQPRGIVFLGDVSLTGTDQYVELKAETCFLSIEGEDKKYSPSEGVSFRPEEKILLNCRAENKTGKDIDVFGSFIIFKRNVSTGEKTEVTEKTPWKDHFSIGEGKDLAIELPTPSKPQAYDIQVSFRDESRFVSNSITAHYVLAGESATITNILFDKIDYQSGEKVGLTVGWIGSAHNFLNSRVSSEAGSQKTETLKIKAVLKDGNGLPCSEELLKNKLKNNQEEKIALTLNNECSGMKAVVTLLGESEKILDQKEVSFKREGVASGSNKKKDPSSKIFPILAIIIISLTLIALLFFYFKLGKKTGPLTLFLLIGISFFGFSNNAHAETKALAIYGSHSSCSGDTGWTMQTNNPITWSSSKESCTRYNIPYCVDSRGYCSTTSDSITTSVSTNKDEYTPEEKVTVSATGTLSNTCGNPITSTMTAKASWGGSTQTIFSQSKSAVNGNAYFTAPNTAGTYTIDITLDFNHNPFYFKKSTSLQIKVVGGAPTPTPSIYSCTGYEPNGTTEFSCPDPGTELDANQPWVNVGSSIYNCSGEKCEYYVPNNIEPPPSPTGGCGGALPGPSSCTNGGHTLGSSASPWRDISLSDGTDMACSGNNCVAKKCNTVAPLISALFSQINLSSTATGPSTTILSWTPLPQVCQTCTYGPSGCWIPDYTPNYGSPSCGASAQFASFNDVHNNLIYNLPVSIVSNSSWSNCDNNHPENITDPENPLPVGDPRGRLGGGHPCQWDSRPANSCSTIQEHNYNIADGERVFTCNSTDLDVVAGGFDTLSYTFKLEELDSGEADTTCGTSWTQTASGGWCRQITAGGNQVYFKSSDARARYQMTCEVSDNAGSTDYSYNLIKVGEGTDPVPSVSCSLFPEKLAVCAGESTKVITETHPDNATVVWSWPRNNQTGNDKNFTLTFTNAHVGANPISMTATDTTGLVSPECNSSVTVLGSSCDVNLEPVGGTDLGALVPGSEVKIVADPSCFVVAPVDAYKFILTKDGGNAVENTDYTNEGGATIGGFQSVDYVTIKIINSGQYAVSLEIKKKDSPGIVATCNNEFLANTSATEWWERRP